MQIASQTVSSTWRQPGLSNSGAELWVSWMSEHPQHFTFWFLLYAYIVVCNLFNAVVTTHQMPVFTSECTETVWWPVLPGSAGVTHSAATDLLAEFKGWPPGKEKDGKERGKESG